MEKFQSITIEKNEQYLRQISKKVNVDDAELHNNIVVLQEYCMQNDVMAMAAIQLGIPKRIIYLKIQSVYLWIVPVTYISLIWLKWETLKNWFIYLRI